MTDSSTPSAQARNAAGVGAHVVRRSLDWNLGPAEALRLLRSDAHPVALFGSWAGGSDIIASEPSTVRSPPQPLEHVMDGAWPVEPGADSQNAASAAFGGGWIGYLGFGLTEQLLPAPPAPGSPRRLPEWWFGYYDHVLRRDRSTGSWFFEALWTPERSDALDSRFDELSRRAQLVDTLPRAYFCGDFGQTPTAEEHRSAVGRAIEYIRRGDIFQANICLQLEAAFTGDPLDAFCRAAGLLQPPYAAFLRIPGGAVASLSPELFLHRTGSTVRTRPIKGTHLRSPDPRDADRQRDMLLRSDKDRAENIMIVDLMRNDLSRASVPGSVVVPRLLSAEAHPGVWHLVSDVQATLSPGSGSSPADGALIAATFPPGSVTGAPKVRAVEIIHELETTPREIYTGAIGYRSPVAGLELNVAIRTFEFQDDRVWLGSGGGITIRSDAAEEYRECLIKAAPLISALGAKMHVRRPPSGARTTPPETGTVSLGAKSRFGAASPRAAGVVAQSMRPRPAAGVFTSLGIHAGQSDNLQKHLSRLEASTQQLFGKDLPPSLFQQLAEVTADQPSGRLRITARPIGGPLQIWAEVLPIDVKPGRISLHPVTIPAGLGAHKWLDRRLLAALTTRLGHHEHLLIQDADGSILETDRANIFAVIDGVLRTPTADGRLLPGVTRAAVLELAQQAGIATSEGTLTVRHLATASEVFLTNSVYGIIPVHGVAAGLATWMTHPVASRIGGLLAELASSQDAVRPISVARTAALRTAALRTTAPRTGKPVVVLIDNYDSFTYNIAHLLATSGCQVEVIRNDETSAEDIATFAPHGIVVSPGPCTPAEAGISIETIRLCAARTPILGVCLGHQAIAAAYGGRVVSAPQPMHGQASAMTHDDRGVLRGLPQQFLAARYHSLLVEEKSLPDCLHVSARTAGGIVMGLRHNTYPSEGIQFHPESILTTHGGSIIGNFTQAMRRQFQPS